MRFSVLAAALGLGALAGMVVARGEDGWPAYPPTRRVDQIDRYHGTEVADPYRWLEADIRQFEEVAAWARAQNAVTAKYLGLYAHREAIRERLKELWNFESNSSPMRAGKGYAYYRNDGLQNQAALYTMETPDSEPRLLIDPNLWSKDGTVTLTGAAFSRDGRHLAYAVSEAGSDWQTWHVLDVANGRSCRSAAGQVGTSAVVRRWRPTVKSPMAIKGFHGRMTIAVMAAANSNRGSSVAGRDLSGILPTDYYYTAHECFSVDFRSCQAFPSR